MSRLRNQILVGDAADQLTKLADASVDMVLTSPPYFRLRDYDHPGQLGLESSVDEWVLALRGIAGQVQRVLTPTGSFWLNVSDTYANHVRQGAAPKSLLLAPERLALTLLEDGWLLRNKIVWAKANPMPSSVRDRLTCSWEALFVFVKQPRYFFDLDAIRVPHSTTHRGRIDPQHVQPRVREAWRGPNGDDASGLDVLKARGIVGHPLGKNPGDVWRIASSSYRGAHHATFPVALAERAIRAGSPEARCQSCRAPWTRKLIRSTDGTATRSPLGPSCDCHAGSEPAIVLDPFFGAGTTAVAAEQLGRDWVGIELNPDFADLARQRVYAARAGPPAAA